VRASKRSTKFHERPVGPVSVIATDARVGSDFGLMAVNVTEVERGDILEIDGDPWQVTEITSQTPSARGASMMVKAKLKNLRTGQGLSKSWRGGETVATADVDTRTVQYLYGRDDAFAFMDLQSYDQFTLDGAQVGTARAYLLDNLELRAVSFGGRVIALQLPITVDLRVLDTGPAIKGATAQAQLKPATVETGLQVMVPSYIEPGERIRVDTRDGRFVERAR
jgi:elongation factor P